MDGALTLDMMNPGPLATSIWGETTRAFEQMEQRHVTELLAAAADAGFFIRPEPVLGVDPGSCVWRIRIDLAGSSRELIIADRNAGPELDRLARAARACLRDRQVFRVDAMPDEMRQAIAMALRDHDAHQLSRDMDTWSRERLNNLADLAESDPSLAAFYGAIGNDNVKIRLRFLSTFPALTAVALADAGVLAPNQIENLDRWRTERRVFALPVGTEQRFPLFQFAQGRPRPVVADVLATLPASRSSWQIAFWFVSSNSWLGGSTPLSLIHTQPEAMVAVAAHEGDEIGG